MGFFTCGMVVLASKGASGGVGYESSGDYGGVYGGVFGGLSF